MISPTIDWGQKGNHLSCILAGCKVAPLALALRTCSSDYGTKLFCTSPSAPTTKEELRDCLSQLSEVLSCAQRASGMRGYDAGNGGEADACNMIIPLA